MWKRVKRCFLNVKLLALIWLIQCVHKLTQDATVPQISLFHHKWNKYIKCLFIDHKGEVIAHSVAPPDEAMR